MQLRLLAIAIVVVLSRSLTSLAATVGTCKAFSSFARIDSSSSDVLFKSILLNERASLIAEQLLSEQSVFTDESVRALQRFSTTYNELVSKRDAPASIEDDSLAFVEASIEGHPQLQEFNHTEPLKLLKTLTLNINGHAKTPKQQFKNFLLVNLLVDDIQILRRVAMTRAGAIYLLIRFSTLRETWLADDRSDLISKHDLLKNLIDRIDDKVVTTQIAKP